MGVLDSLFLPQSNPDSGLLARLFGQMGNEAMMQGGMSPADIAFAQAPSPQPPPAPAFGSGAAPGVGYGSQAFNWPPQFAQAPQAPQAAPALPPPVDVTGGVLPPVSMPTMGGPPPSAMPAAPAVASPYFAPPPGPGILERLFNGIGTGIGNNSNALLAFGGGTLQGGIGRGLSAMAAASPLDRAARQEQQGNAAMAATYNALRRAGHSEAEALAGSQNPEILKTLIAKPVFGVIGENPITGAKQYGWTNAATQTVTPFGGVAGSGGTQGEMPSGQAYLDQFVPRELHNSVRAMANYDVPTSGLGSLKQLTPHVVNFDPNFDAANYPAKVALKKSFMGGGKDFQGLEAFNTVGTHMGELMEAAKALNPSDWKIANNIRNLFSDYVTDNPRLVRFRNALNTTQHELGNAYHAGHITDSSLHSFQQSIADNMSTPGLKAAIGEMAGLLGGKINAKEENYNLSFPGKQLPPGFQALNSRTKAAFQGIRDWANDIAPGGGEDRAPSKVGQVGNALSARPGEWLEFNGVRVREVP